MEKVVKVAILLSRQVLSTRREYSCRINQDFNANFIAQIQETHSISVSIRSRVQLPRICSFMMFQGDSYFLHDTQNGYVLRACHSLSKILHDHRLCDSLFRGRFQHSFVRRPSKREFMYSMLFFGLPSLHFR